jgi:hypothetical protein
MPEELARFQLARGDLQPLHLLIVVALSGQDRRVSEQVAHLRERHTPLD